MAAVFTAKGRPHFNPLICHYPDADAAFRHVDGGPDRDALAAAFWPGPLTLVLPRRVTCPVALLAGAGLDTLAVRVPAHPVAQALLHAVGRPVAAPSANRSGAVSPTTADHVLDGLDGRIAAVVDGGPCAVGRGIDGAGPDRAAAVPAAARRRHREAIEAVLGPVGRGLTPAEAEATRTLRSPGLLVSHYAPCLPLRLDAGSVAADEALLAFGPPLPGAAPRSSSAPAATWRRRRRACSPGCARWTRCQACAGSPRCRCPAAGWAPRSTTGCNAPRRRGNRAAVPCYD